MSDETVNNHIGRQLILLAAGCAICYFLFFHFMKLKNENQFDETISPYIFSRISTGEIKKFKDKSIIHGPIYFYFQSTMEDVVRLRKFLRLNRQQELPRVFFPSIGYMRENVDWDFDWSEFEVFSVYYCGGNIIDWGFDMLITDRNHRSIYVTSGYISNLSEPVGDFELCGN